MFQTKKKKIAHHLDSIPTDQFTPFDHLLYDYLHGELNTRLSQMHISELTAEDCHYRQYFLGIGCDFSILHHVSEWELTFFCHLSHQPPFILCRHTTQARTASCLAFGHHFHLYVQVFSNNHITTLR